MVGRISHRLLLLALVGTVAHFCGFWDAPQRTGRSLRVLMSLLDESRPLYSQRDIMRTGKHIDGSVPRLLVFDGENFTAYSLVHDSLKEKVVADALPSWRSVMIIPTLVHALKTSSVFQSRLQSSSDGSKTSPFQVLYTEADSAVSNCDNTNNCGPMAPVLGFTSVPRNRSVFPSLKAFPSPVYMNCIHHWHVVLNGRSKFCNWAEQIDTTIAWQELKPQMVWRGDDVKFSKQYGQYNHLDGNNVLDQQSVEAFHHPQMLVNHLMQSWNQLRPPMKAVTLALEATHVNHDEWIDAKFIEPVRLTEQVRHKLWNLGMAITTEMPVSSNEISQYKYQLDIGGTSGTAWAGTLSKLQMPGVLFHQETAYMDWFHGRMKPWVHYIPIREDMSDLREKYDWAVAHDDECKAISDRASRLGKHMLSAGYMRKLWQELFVDYLGSVVRGYQHEDRTWEESLGLYRESNFTLVPLSVCDDMRCKTLVEEDGWDESGMHTTVQQQRVVDVVSNIARKQLSRMS